MFLIDFLLPGWEISFQSSLIWSVKQCMWHLPRQQDLMNPKCCRLHLAEAPQSYRTFKDVTITLPTEFLLQSVLTGIVVHKISKKPAIVSFLPACCKALFKNQLPSPCAELLKVGIWSLNSRSIYLFLVSYRLFLFPLKLKSNVCTEKDR